MRYFVTAEGVYIGGFDVPAEALAELLPDGAVEVPHAPEDARQKWDGESFSPPPPPVKRYSPLEFFDLFTEDEEAAIFAARYSNPQVDRWLTRAAAASYIDTADERTVSGIQALVAAGLLTQARADAILGG